MGARATGTSHVATDLPCQDRFSCAAPSPAHWVAALADGAGSASLAERSAETAVRTAVRSIERAIDADRFEPRAALELAAVEARTDVLLLADREGVESRHAACTLLLVVLSPYGGAALQIGDGLIAVAEEPGEWSWVFWPQRGEYANTTRFLTDDDAEKRWMLDELPQTVADVALLSDGLEALALHYASLTAHGPFFEALLAPLAGINPTDSLDAEARAGEILPLSRSLERFLSSERVTERTDDDVSLVVATRRRPSESE